MHTTTVIHNPGAGEEGHDDQVLKDTLTAEGINWMYVSTKDENWEEIGEETDFIIVAGGDGTIRKVVKQLVLGNLRTRSLPMAVLPWGTANNIYKTLKGPDDAKEIVQSWKKGEAKKLDVGIVHTAQTEDFFLEGLGFGLFPTLMKEMKDHKFALTPDEKLNKALEVMHELLQQAKAMPAQIRVDGQLIEGQFLLIELMNIRSIGPNLVLAPQADPGDGAFELVLVRDDQREEFSDFLRNRIEKITRAFPFEIIRGQQFELLWGGEYGHIDDEFLEFQPFEPIRIELNHARLTVLNDEAKAERNDVRTSGTLYPS